MLHAGRNDMGNNIIVLFVLLFTASAAISDEKAIDDLWFAELKPLVRENFISPDVCGKCHEEIHYMWSGSLHSNAFDDVLFRAATKLFVRDTANPGEQEDAEHCVSCHNPIAYRSGQIKGSSDNYDNVDEVTKHSISCDFCHSVDEIVMIKNASYNIDAGGGEDDPGTKRGPRDDAESMYHESVYSALHTSSDFCGTCHNVTHLWYMTKLEGTYDEWYSSPYNSADPEKRVNCQDCHMRQSPGKPSTGMTERPDYPGTSSEMGEERPHIFQHNVVGANVYMPVLLGNPEKAFLARERLQNAAALEIIPKTERNTLESFSVRVKNEGAGHMLPTGVTEFRQMWLEISVKDNKNNEVYSSGIVDTDGNLSVDTHLFNTVFGDSEGNPTINVVKASRIISDHRIHPKGYCDETYVPEKPLHLPLTIDVTLNYRSMDPSVVALLLGNEAQKPPVVTMAALRKKIE